MWTVDRLIGDAGDIHARQPPADIAPTVWQIEVTAPALVLGSSQSFDDVDLHACHSAGVDVVRRRSGGGAVLLLPDEMLWVDVILPADHPAWDDDIVRSAWWLGDIWSAALADVGCSTTGVHHAGLVSSPWSRLVCFTGVGPGEVMVDDRKLIGISQRRTRHHARFQCMLHRVWRPEMMASLLLTDDPSLETALAEAATTCLVDNERLVEALVSRLDDGQPARAR